MKQQINLYRKIMFAAIALFIFSSCERELSEDAVFATFPNTAEVFTDVPVGLTDEFFISFDPAGGANTDGFGTDENEVFDGAVSIRIDVPASNDPNGNFIGGIFKDRGQGRNLTEYNTLSFWAKGSASGTLGTVGFGNDFEGGLYPAALNNLQLTTDWRKYYVPIPNPSRLTQEKGMFIFAAGGLDVVDDIPNGNEIAWTFWLDEIKFENIGTLGDPQPAIMNGSDVVVNTFNDVNTTISNLFATYNTPGGDVTVDVAPSYFDFSSSSPSVATVNALGDVNVRSSGETTITGILNGFGASGSLQITSNGNLPTPPTPTVDAQNVKSVFSDSYTSDTQSNFAPGFGGSTTQTSSADINGNNVLIYSSNNFTGIIHDNTIDASALNFLHIDVFTQNAGSSVEFQIRDIGANGEIETNVFNGFPSGDDRDRRFTASNLSAGQWTSIDIPLDGDIANQKNNLGALIIVGGPDFILDNIYYY